MPIQTVTIVGLGALGIMFGDHLARHLPAGSVRATADAARLARYREQGVFCNERRCDFAYIDPSVSNDPADLVIFATKYGALADAMELAAHQVGPDTTIISLLNGIVSEDDLARRFGSQKVLLCTAQGMDATHQGTCATYTNLGSLAIGAASSGPEQTRRLAELAAFFDRTELPYLTPANMRTQLWNKLVCNDGINQTCMVYECGYAGIQSSGEARDTMVAAMGETIAVAQAEGVSLPGNTIESWLNVLASLNPNSMPSMRQDALARRPSEVALFGGTVCALGRKHGVPTPVNDRLVARIAEIEATY